MKKQLLAIAALCTALCACQKASTEQEGVIPQEKEDTSVPEKIRLSGTLMDAESVTKASVDSLNGQPLYVVGYDISKIGSATAITEAQGFVIPNIKGTAPVTGAPNIITFTDTYFYEEQVEAYDFNGYYVDQDATITTPIYVSGGLIKLGLTLNGSQDILAAITDKEADRVIADSVCTKYGYPKGSKVNSKYVYSAFAARRRVQPKLNFEHMLSKFSFELRIGNVYYNPNDSIRVSKLSIAAPKNGTLILNPVNGTTKINSYVEAASGTDTAMDLSCAGLKLDFGTDSLTFTPVPGSLMVIPGVAEYTMTLTYRQDNTDNKDHTLTVPININKVKWTDEAKKTDKFTAGKHYVVKVVIYGLEKIEVSVDLADWDNVGSIKYDPDDIEGGIEKPAA